MTLSIPIPAIPIKVTIGKEKKEDAPIAAPVVAPSQSKLDGRDFAIACVSAIAIVAIIAILILAMRHQSQR